MKCGCMKRKQNETRNHILQFWHGMHVIYTSESNGKDVNILTRLSIHNKTSVTHIQYTVHKHRQGFRHMQDLQQVPILRAIHYLCSKLPVGSVHGLFSEKRPPSA